jgi:hypothetical protein
METVSTCCPDLADDAIPAVYLFHKFLFFISSLYEGSADLLSAETLLAQKEDSGILMRDYSCSR